MEGASVRLSAELETCRVELRDLLHAQTRALDALIHDLTNNEGLADSEQREIINTIALMLQGLGVSIHSALRLTSDVDMAIRDAFGIARSAAELGVNIAYIATGGVALAQRAQQHALQKRYRDASRSGTIGGLKVDVSAPRVPVDEVPGLKAALAAFTDAKGRERRDWTGDNIDDRIAAVRSKNPGAALSLSGSIFAIYRHSSELLHGTYFSVVFFWLGSGIRERPYSRDAFARTWMSDHFVTIFTALFFAANGAIEAVRGQFGLSDDYGQKTPARRAQETTERLNSILRKEEQ